MKDWQDFTQTQPSALFTRNFIADADDLGLILVTGDDAQSFLQNQLSNDISHIDKTKSQLSSYSTAKGRMLGIFRIMQIDNGYILITIKSLVVDLISRLQMFVLSSKVSVADASAHFARFVVHTDQLDTTSPVTSLTDKLLPDSPNAVLQNDSVISLQLNQLGDQHRYLFLCLSFDEAKSLWQQFSANLNIANFESWRLSDIRAGIPNIYPQTVEQFVLQMSNLDLLDGVSFKKGCFPGQEIIARMHYLGKLKRRLFLATLETGQCPLPGDEICTKTATTADGSGMVVDAIIDDNGLCHCIYVAQIKKVNEQSLCLLNQPSVNLNSADLPYSLPA
jgi:folate-binding protein YgfZ